MVWIIVILEHPSTTHLQCPGGDKETFHSRFPCTWPHSSFPWPLAKKRSQNIILNGWDGVLGVQISFFSLQIRRVELMPKCSIFVSTNHSTFSQPSFESSRCLFVNFRQVWTCAFLLVMVILVTVAPTAFRSSTSTYCLVLGCFLAFLIIKFTPH